MLRRVFFETTHQQNQKLISLMSASDRSEIVLPISVFVFLEKKRACTKYLVQLFNVSLAGIQLLSGHLAQELVVFFVDWKGAGRVLLRVVFFCRGLVLETLLGTPLFRYEKRSVGPFVLEPFCFCPNTKNIILK